MKNDKSSAITNENVDEKKKTKKVYKYISERERYLIEYMYTQKKMNIYQIAKELNREYSTVYREIKKGLVIQKDTYLRERMIYKADYAQTTTKENLSQRGREMKCKRNCEFLEYIEHKIIKEKYSPRAALVQYNKDKTPEKQPVCVNTLYNYILYSDVTKIQPKHLPYKRKKNEKHDEKRTVSLRNTISRTIDERDKSVFLRDNFGHWEMDTVIGKKTTKSCLLVLTERKSRIELTRKIKDKSMGSVVTELDKLEKEIGRINFSKVFKTITSDNGCEFMDSMGIEKNNRTIHYYCHPYRSNERGSNENQNKLVRRLYPKGCDFTKTSTRDIYNLQRFINEYPRLMFDNKSSLEYVQENDPMYYELLKKVL